MNRVLAVIIGVLAMTPALGDERYVFEGRERGTFEFFTIFSGDRGVRSSRASVDGSSVPQVRWKLEEADKLLGGNFALETPVVLATNNHHLVRLDASGNRTSLWRDVGRQRLSRMVAAYEDANSVVYLFDRQNILYRLEDQTLKLLAIYELPLLKTLKENGGYITHFSVELGKEQEKWVDAYDTREPQPGDFELAHVPATAPSPWIERGARMVYPISITVKELKLSKDTVYQMQYGEKKWIPNPNNEIPHYDCPASQHSGPSVRVDKSWEPAAWERFGLFSCPDQYSSLE